MTTTSVVEFAGSLRNRVRDTWKSSAPGWLAVTVAIMALAATLPAPAQITRGSISGLVVDSSGSVVPGASVTLTETETNVGTRAKSESDGLFLIAGLLPGVYSIKVEAGGFKTLVKKNGSPQEFDGTRILGCFFEDHEFGLGRRHALRLQQ